MQFRAFEPGIDVSGGVVKTVISAFALTPSLARSLLEKHGIIQAGNTAEINPEAWYPLDKWLQCYEGIAAAGSKSIYYIGTCIPKDAKFPPHISSIESGLLSIDVAYHMNHRKNGRAMFDPRTGAMQEGIGHYEMKPVDGQNAMVCRCMNPYPCDFDLGLLTAMSQRFEKSAKVSHADESTCRKKNADSCTYTIKW